MCGIRDVVISPGGGGAIISGFIAHTGVHSEMAGDHHGTGGMPTHLGYLYQGVAESRDIPDDDMVGSGCGTRI